MRITINIPAEQKERVLAAFGETMHIESPKPADIKAFLAKKLSGVIRRGEQLAAERAVILAGEEVNIT